MTWLKNFENKLNKTVPNGTEILFTEKGFFGKSFYMRIKNGKFEIINPSTKHLYERYQGSASCYWSNYMDNQQEQFVCRNLQEIVDAFKEKARMDYQIKKQIESENREREKCCQDKLDKVKF